MSGAPPPNSRRVPLDKRKRTETSCDKCKSRKQKCKKEPGEEACHYCKLHDIKCLTTQPRKKRLYGSVEGIGYRLSLLEALVKNMYPDLDVSSIDDMRRLAVSLGIELPDEGWPDKDSHHNANDNNTDVDEPLSLLPDQQGQTQYIGPASSFCFHLKLRALVGQSGPRESVLFGRNAAAEEPPEGGNGANALSTPSTVSNQDRRSPTEHQAPSQDYPTYEDLMGAYFAHVNPDFPVLHEPTFREAYRRWQGDTERYDPAWLCSFFCLLLLARRITPTGVPEEHERTWWRRVQSLLPYVIFTSSVTAVQALMLASLHLHNTNHRDACWNLTGTAIRIAVAIGLHQDKVTIMQPPLMREIRKRLWWTLYAFEQMQVSSYDRPSAIEPPCPKIGCPNDSLIGMADYYPEGYSKWFNRLVVHLACACRAPKNTKLKANDESYVGPLSPASSVLRDLVRWKESLPANLRLDAVDSQAPPCARRPILLLHAKFHYTLIVLCRCALLTRANMVSREQSDFPDTTYNAMADPCAQSGRALADILLKLDAIGKFDPFAWWDVWYALTSASMLLIDLVGTKRRDGTDVPESRALLSQLSDLCNRHMQSPRLPGTIRKWASMVPELYSMVEPTDASSKPDASAQRSSTQQVVQTPDLADFAFQSITNSGAYMFTYNGPSRLYPEPQFLPTAAPFPHASFERGTGMGFMDFNSLAEWDIADQASLGMMPQGHTQP